MTMTSAFSFVTGAATHVGAVRRLNEDSLLARPEIGLWVVADGMGGHGGGDVASQAAVRALATIEPTDSAPHLLSQFEDRIFRVNTELSALARSRGQSVIGTTVAAILIHGSHYACVWCGDSRAYLLRGGGMIQISRDHSEVQDLIDRGILQGAEARTWPRRNVITRALGVNALPDLEIADGPAFAEDRFLLCSDGLTNHVNDAEIAAILGAEAPQKACDDLISLTLNRGASDNVSIVIVACESNTKTVRADGAWSKAAVGGGIADRGIG
jgi:serine/threonine protein phosphatase PrpC